MRYLLVTTMGIPAVIAAGIGVIWALRKEAANRLFTVLLLVYLTVYTLVVLRNVRPSFNDHMLIPILPHLALFIGFGAMWLRNKLSQRALVGAGVALAVVLITLIPAVQVMNLFMQPDTRSVMQQWVHDHIPQGARVHLATAYNIPLDPTVYDVSQTFGVAGITLEEMSAQGIEYAVVSDALYWDAARSYEWISADYIAMVRDWHARFDEEATLIAGIDRPVWMTHDRMMNTASYWHHPSLRLYCLTEASCAAVQ